MSKNISYNPTDKRRRPYLVSYDWMSVSVQLTRNFDPQREKQQSGYTLKPKPYGSKMWAHIAEVYEPDGTLLGTLAWEPRSTSISSLAGIFKAENQVLYESDMWDRICAGLLGLGVKFKNISRMDLACDFNEFFNGLHPQTLINGYISGEYVKVGLNRAYAFIDPNTYTTAHSDEDFKVYDRCPNFEGTKQRARDEKWVAERNEEIANSGLPLLEFKQCSRVNAPRAAHIQSLTFGRASNPVQVILYDKSKELREVKMKRYIVDNWRRAGLDLSRPVWRVEIRLRSEAAKVENLVNGEIQTLSLMDIVAQKQLEAIFTAYSEKYFKWYRFDGHAKIQNSPRQQVFSFDEAPVFRPKRAHQKKDATNYVRGLVSAIERAADANANAGNALTALHCNRVAKFFRDCYDGLNAVKAHDAREAYRRGHVAQPMDGLRHVQTVYDGYDADRAIQIGTEVTAAHQRLKGTLNLADQYERSVRSTINWDNLDEIDTAEQSVVDAINDAIISSIFSSPKNLTYDSIGNPTEGA